MLTIEEALAIIEHAMRPAYLTSIQELVLRQCWIGLTYQEMADLAGYDSDYIRVVGSRLWQILSQLFGAKITKNNIQAVLRQYANQTSSGHPILPPVATREPIATDLSVLELPEGPVPIGSPFYIERPFTDAIAYTEIAKPGALIRIKAPKQWGKTSLLNRISAAAAALGYQSARINIQQADSTVFDNLNSFLRWFCANLTQQLTLASRLDDYWDDDLGSKASCTTYLQSYVLRQLNTPLILALDEVNLIFEYPSVAQDFLPLLRFWHEEANNLPIWGNLRIVVSHSTEIYIPLNLNQSPFNVGMPIKLNAFSLQQIQELAKRHQLTWVSHNSGMQVLQSLHLLTDGHPYLVRLMLYTLARGDIEPARVLHDAPTSAGVYANHLLSHLVMLQQHPELAAAFRTVIQADQPLAIETVAAYKLQSMGLVRLVGDEVVPSCELYRLYFQHRLDQV